MEKHDKYTVSLPWVAAGLNLAALAVSALIYAAFAVYLYLPHFNHFEPYRPLFIPAAIVAGSGAFILAGRWVSNPIAAFFTGVLYAFGPFSLGFALYHPAASILYAAIPWLFLPATFWPHTPSRRSAGISAVLMLIPVAAIVAFFEFAAHYAFFPIPISERFHIYPSVSLLSPLPVVANQFPVVGCYHVAAAPLIFGLFMFLRIHRVAAIAVFVLGIALAVSVSMFEISPIIWASLPVLCLCILAGLGLNGLVLATAADSFWLTLCALIVAGLTLLCSLMSLHYPRLAFASALYLLAAVVTFAILLFASTNKKYHALRWFLFSLTLAADIFLSAHYILAKLF